MENLTEIQVFWKNLYEKYFNLEIDPSIIQEREGKWAIFIAKGLSMQQVYDALPFAKSRYKYEPLDKAIPTNDRISNKDYIVYVRQNIEADNLFKGKSLYDLQNIGHVGITVLERLVLELYYFEKTGKHLDTHNITLCSGSRFSGGYVPGIQWFVYKISITYYGVLRSFDSLRSREVFF